MTRTTTDTSLLPDAFEQSMNIVEKRVVESPTLDESYEKYIHSSGLEIYIFPKDMSSTYAIFGTKYGGIHNVFSQGENGEMLTVPDGIAHFLEHKLFANEDGSDSFERFSAYGADANAYTSFNKTAYLFSTTSDLYAPLAELLEFVTHPYFTPESVASEIGIISEEIKMYDDNPSDRCFFAILDGLYEHHSVKRNICGSVQSISQISAQTLYTCYNAFYNLKNMVLIICGKVDRKRIFATINEHIPASSPPFSTVCPSQNEAESPNAFKDCVELSMHVNSPIFSIGFKDVDIPALPALRAKKDAAMSILNDMLFSRAGELYNSLFESDLLSLPSLSYEYTLTPSFAYGSLSGHSKDPYAVRQRLFEHIEQLCRVGLSQKAFLRSKRVMYADFVRSFDSSDSIANDLLSFACDGGELLSYADAINDVTLEDVQTLLRSFFVREHSTLAIINPLPESGR